MEKNINPDSLLSGLSQSELDKASNEIDINSDKSKAIVKMAESLFNFAKKHKEIPVKKAAKNYLVYTGKQWDWRQPSFKTVPVTNVIWGTIEYEVPLMTENKPVIKAIPRTAQDMDYAEGATKGLEYVWDYNNMTYRLPFIMRDVLVLGDTFVKVYWDYILKEIVIDDVEMDYFFPEPFVSSINRMKYCIHAEPRMLYDIAEMYPNGKFVKAENISNPLADALKDESMASSMYTDESRESYMAEGQTTSKEGSMYTGQGIVKEMFIDDRTLVTKSQVIMGEDGEPLYEIDEKTGDYKLDDKKERIPKRLFYQERKYPFGRYITWANEILLADFPAEFKHGKPPYVQFHNIKMKRSFWSTGDPWQLISIQTQINKRKAQIDFMADQIGNAIWVVDADSGVRRNQITNQPGLIVYKRPGTEVRREAPPSIPDYMFKDLENLKYEADFISGIPKVITGEKPGSVTAGAAIAELVERAIVRVKEKTKYMEESIASIGRYNISYIRQFWDEPKQFTITGTPFLQNQQMMGQQQNPQMMGGQQQNPQMSGMQQDYKMIEFSGASLTADPDIKVVAGSTMPTSRTTKFEQAVIMLTNGAIDRQEFLKYIEYPNAEAVLARLNQQEQMVMQQQREDDEKQFRLKMANYMARLESTNIGSKTKIYDTMLKGKNKMDEVNADQAFNLNRLLMGPTNSGGEGY